MELRDRPLLYRNFKCGFGPLVRGAMGVHVATHIGQPLTNGKQAKTGFAAFIGLHDRRIVPLASILYGYADLFRISLRLYKGTVNAGVFDYIKEQFVH